MLELDVRIDIPGGPRRHRRAIRLDLSVVLHQHEAHCSVLPRQAAPHGGVHPEDETATRSPPGARHSWPKEGAGPDQSDSAVFLSAARVTGMPRCAASMRSAIWAWASSPNRSRNLAMPSGRNSHDSVTCVPPSTGVKV